MSRTEILLLARLKRDGAINTQALSLELNLSVNAINISIFKLRRIPHAPKIWTVYGVGYSLKRPTKKSHANS